jgi:hypothetical protein
MPLSKDLREFVECLNSNEVEYLVVGRWPYRGTVFPVIPPISISSSGQPENAGRILRAIHQFGFGSLDVTIEDLTLPGRVIQLGREPNRIDLITAISGVNFEDAWQTRVAGQLDGIDVSIIGRAALLRNKEGTGRAKDRIDVEELRKLDPS